MVARVSDRDLESVSVRTRSADQELQDLAGFLTPRPADRGPASCRCADL